jgi:hypothetical protein
VVEPVSGLLCKVPITPRVTVRNIGRDTLRSVELGMIYDGVPLGTITQVNGLSVPTFGNSSVQVLLPNIVPTPGNHSFRVYTRNPNGSTDQRPNNDTTTVTFTVAPGLTLPYFESFNTLPFPPNNGSAVINPDAPVGTNTGLTWARTTLAGNPGTASIRINMYNYQTVGQRDIYRTPKVDVTGLDSLVVTFNVAYRQYFGTDVPAPPSDSLRVVISPDCGVSWLPTAYAKGGASLSTVAGTTDSSFVP